MTYMDELRKTTLDFLARIQAANAEIEKVEAQRSIYSADRFAEMMNVATGERDAVVREGRQAIKDLADAAKEAVRAEYTPRGEDLTPDAALFSSGLDLGQKDIEQIFDRYAAEGNHTMMRLALEYAAAHDVHVDRAYLPETVKADAVDTLALYSTGALTDAWRAELVTSDDYWGKITPEALR